MMSAKMRRTTALIGYLKDSGFCSRQKVHVCSFMGISTTISARNSIPNILFCRSKVTSSKTNITNNCPFVLCSTRGYCSPHIPQRANVFGDLGNEKYERVEMDENEEAEERFVENEVRVPRRLKPSAGQYAAMIRDRINKGDVDSALEVLDLIKQNRDKPTTYIYNLIIRGFAVQGLVKKCFKLYNDMKKRALKPNGATYTSLINACATSNDNKALEYFLKLREEFHVKSIPLEEAHYHAMIKAYSWHNKILEAFEIADEMRDKMIPITETTMNSLMHAAVSDKKTGLRHALVLWHSMPYRGIKRSVLTYNLLLRCIRDTKFGDLKVNEDLMAGTEDTKILINENERPDLLASPPTLTNLVTALPQENKRAIQEGKSTEQGIALQKEPKSLLECNLDDVLSSNRLLLFGGYNGILSRMDADKVKPDIRTFTLLMELVPSTTATEDAITKCALSRKVELDVDYFNMLMKKRCMRFEYDAAKEVLYQMQREGLRPNIMTFGILALGCLKPKDGWELIEGLENTGFTVNSAIMGTLVANACHKKYFTYLAELLDYIYDNKIKPNETLFKHLEKLQKDMNKITSQKPGRFNRAELRDLKKRYAAFEEKYLKWKEKMEQSDERRKKKIEKFHKK